MYVHSNVEVAGEAEIWLADEREKYDARVATYKASKQYNPPLSKGVLIFDEVKVAAKLHWNSRNDALVGHSMTAQEMWSVREAGQLPTQIMLCKLYGVIWHRIVISFVHITPTVVLDHASMCDGCLTQVP